MQEYQIYFTNVYYILGKVLTGTNYIIWDKWYVLLYPF